MNDSSLTARLVLLALAGWLLFGFPLLQLWIARPLWLFGLWGGVIAVLAWWMERSPE